MAYHKPYTGDVNKVLEEGSEDQLREALTWAKALCKVGKIIELMDFLCPEDTKISFNPTTGRTQKK